MHEIDIAVPPDYRVVVGDRQAHRGCQNTITYRKVPTRGPTDPQDPDHLFGSVAQVAS